MSEFTIEHCTLGRSIIRLDNGDEYTLNAAGNLCGVGFTDPEIPRTPADWDAAYARAEAWLIAHPVIMRESYG